MAVDVATLLRELDVAVTGGSTVGSWLLHAPDGTRIEVTPAPAVERMDAQHVRGALAHGRRPLLVGASATPTTVARAQAGEVDILTERPIRLIYQGRTYEADEPASSETSRQGTPRGRPAWIRWALERYLLLAKGPVRQPAIAAQLGTSQQAISAAVRKLKDLVTDHGGGVITRDRRALLAHWTAEYAGPGGHQFGWYGLADTREQARVAATVAASLDAQPLVSGDVAADVIAPWKLPARGRIYVRKPVDLAGDGFVPAPLEDATLITCVPRDPTLWRLIDAEVERGAPGSLPLADPPIVLWDLLNSSDVDSDAAAEKVAALIVGAGE